MAAREQAVTARAAATPSPSRLGRAHLVFWGSLVVLLLIAFSHETYLFTTPIHEQGDEALNSLLVMRAEHFQQLVGNYSRVGFHHPGPALFYVLAAGQAFFHGLLHVAAAPYNGQLLGASVYAAVLTSLAVLAIYRATRSTAAAAIACGGFAIFAVHHSMFGNVWFPYLYIAPFLLFMVAGAALAAGNTVELPAYVLGAGFLAHGHVSFLMFVSVTTVAVAACWFVRHRAGWRAELGDHRRGVVGALVLVALFLLPIVVELALHFPGPWRGYVDYVGHHNPPRGAGDVARFTGWYWTHGTPLWLTVASLVVAAALVVRDRRGVFPYLYGMIVLQTVLFVFYVARGVDTLDSVNRYVGYFYLTAPLLLAVTAGVQLAVRVPRRWAVPASAVAVVAGAALLISAVVVAQPRDKYRHGTDYAALVKALAAAPARDGRVVAIDFEHDLWPQAAGVGVAAQRAGLPWCTSNHRWVNLFTAPYVCRADHQQWTLALWPASSVPSGTVIVWHDAHLAVVERDPHAPLLPAYA